MTGTGNKALLLGCGNIGAGYDFEDTTGKVWSHAKALYVLNIPSFVYDADQVKTREVAAKYGFQPLLAVPDMSDFSIVCIATPTSTHFDLLQKALKAEVPLIICEKPVALDTGQLKKLAELKKASRSRVLINYMRRFLPEYIEMRNHILSGEYGDFIGGEMTYCRGFVNNGSHALDLLEFLFGQAISMSSFNKLSFSNDVFENDPTISGQFLFKSAPIQLLGLTYAEYRVFEVRLFFSRGIIDILSGGDQVRYHGLSDTGNLSPGKSMEGILQKYMLPVYSHALTLLENPDTSDNFDHALRLNLEMLTVINK